MTFAAQDILSAYPEDMEPEEWALILPGLQSKMVEAERQAAVFKEARNVVMERALNGRKDMILEGYKYAKVTKTAYSDAKLARDYPEVVDAVIADLRASYKPKVTKSAVDRILAQYPEETRLEIKRNIIGDEEVSFIVTAVKGTKGADA